MENELYTYDSLLELDPYIHEQRARARAEGFQEGRTEGFRRVVIKLVGVRFPALVELAGERVAQLNESDALTRLIEQIAAAPDEAMARCVLDNY